jgi:hypothetical protein
VISEISTGKGIKLSLKASRKVLAHDLLTGTVEKCEKYVGEN